MAEAIVYVGDDKKNELGDPRSGQTHGRKDVGGTVKTDTLILNFNVGMLGHVDSGKTSLAKVLSTIASTACFDKNPQSQERGITLDLGFSSFCVDLPDHLRSHDGVTNNAFSHLQITLVDCPGHASLIRTIIGGAQIIDMMVLVVDVTKGVQTQTAECLVIGEITCDKMIVVLNKIDLLADDKRSAIIERMTKKMQKTLETTKFAGCRIIPVAAKPAGLEDGEPIGITQLIDTLKEFSFVPKRDMKGPFIFAVDHCFSIKGQGTVMTGTVISGSVNINDNIEIPAMKITKKIKSMQMFKKSVSRAVQGDRVGMCVTQFDPKQLERGLLCSPGVLMTVNAAIVRVAKISYFKGLIATKAKFHITIGHDTVMGRGTFFSRAIKKTSETNEFDYLSEYIYQDALGSSLTASTGSCGDVKDISKTTPGIEEQFALLEFESPIVCAKNFVVIGSKLDTDIHSNTCRLAFHGRVIEPIVEQNYIESVLPQLKVYKNKHKEGVVERRLDNYTLVCRGLFKKETDMKVFVGLKVSLSTGEFGVIEGGFGQSGKFKVRVPSGLGEAASQLFSGKAGKKSKSKTSSVEQPGSESAAAPNDMLTEDDHTAIKVLLDFKRYMFDSRKQMIQN